MSSVPFIGTRRNQWAFSPQCLSNCVVWFDAADTSSYSITPFSWRNKCHRDGGNDKTDSPSVGTITLSTINNISALSFNNAPVTMPTLTYTQNSLTVFIVVSSPAINIVFLQDNTFGVTMQLIGKKLILSNASSNVFIETNGNNVNLSSPSICCASVTSSDIVGGIYINGASINSTDNKLPFQPGTTIGQTIGSTADGIFIIGEILIFDGAIPIIQRQQIEGYLSAKWRIAIPATHPYSIIIRPLNRIFQPVDIAGCQLWLDAADATTIVGTPSNVSSWNDKSGNGNNATQSTTANQPTYSNNGIVMNGISNTLSSPVTIPRNTHCLIAVHNPTTLAENTNLLRFYSGTTYIVFPYHNNTTGRGYISSFDGTDTAFNTGTLSEYSVAGSKNLIIANIASASQFIYNNGTLQNSATASLTPGTSDPLTIGSVLGTSEFYKGTIYEIIIYNTSLTNSQRLQIEAYLAQKWSIPSSLPVSHPGHSLPSFSTQFTPKALAPALWLDAADSSTITLSGSNVTAWADKSGTGYTASRYTGDAGTLTISTIAGRTSVYSAYPRMTIPSFVWNNAFTQFIVARATTEITTGLSDVESGGGSNQYNWIYTANASFIYLNKTLSLIDTEYWPKPIPVANTWVILCIGCNLGSTLSHYTLNGTSRLAYIDAGSSVSAGSNTGYFTINGLSYFSSRETYMGEIVHYNRSLSINERQQVEGYLAWKWGTQGSLPSTHPYVKFQP